MNAMFAPACACLHDVVAAMFTASAEPTPGPQGKAGSECMERNLPFAKLESFKTSAWASVDLEGTVSTFVISIAGQEAAVDRMAERLERDFQTGKVDPGGALLADIVRTDTDKTVDGRGRAVSLLTFEALVITD